MHLRSKRCLTFTGPPRRLKLLSFSRFLCLKRAAFGVDLKGLPTTVSSIGGNQSPFGDYPYTRTDYDNRGRPGAVQTPCTNPGNTTAVAVTEYDQETAQDHHTDYNLRVAKISGGAVTY